MEGGVFIKLSSKYSIGVLAAVVIITLLILKVLGETGCAIDIAESEVQPETITTLDDLQETKAEVIAEVPPIIETLSDTIYSAEENKLAIINYTDSDAIDIAKVLYGECRGVLSTTERACVVWTILNRVDSNNATIHDVVSSPQQFAFAENTPVDETLLSLAYDVLERWNDEKNGEINVGRVLPASFCWFEGRDNRNYFRNQYNGDYIVWDYSLESPYES